MSGRRSSMIVGVDIGTQSLKAVVLSHELDVLGQNAVAYQPAFPQPGWAQQDPKLWEKPWLQPLPEHSAAANRNRIEYHVSWHRRPT